MSAKCAASIACARLSDRDAVDRHAVRTSTKSIAQWAKELCVLEGAARTTEDVPVGFCNVSAGGRGICQLRRLSWFDARAGKQGGGQMQISL